MEPSEVKSEELVVEEEAPQTARSSELQMLPNVDGFANGDEAATLAELWPSRKPKSDSSTTTVPLSLSLFPSLFLLL